MTAAKKISIMGSTGSIGTSALSVVAHANSEGESPAYEIDTLVAGRNVAELARQAVEFNAKRAVIDDDRLYKDLKAALAGYDIDVAAGSDAVDASAARPVDRVVAAIVGIDGLSSTLAAIEAGNSVALANKESMVCAGPMLRRRAAETGALIVPTDSEHNAMFQVMERHEDIETLILTASGGPFRTTPKQDLEHVTFEAALNHPRWEMGRKISIDSATLFNKGLELIEAAYLFDIPEDRIDVVVHPQSIIHSLVAYRDGSVLAQMGDPDMRTPIAYALSWPDRRQPAAVKRLDLIGLGRLDFEALDENRFPSVGLCRAALREGGGATVVLNCANERAVAAFLAGHCRFNDISWIVERAVNRFLSGAMSQNACDTIEVIMAIEAEAGRITDRLLTEAAHRQGAQ